MSAGRGGPELSTDHVLLIIVCSIGVSVMIANGRRCWPGSGCGCATGSCWSTVRAGVVGGPAFPGNGIAGDYAATWVFR